MQFDIEAFKARTQQLRWDDLDLTEFRDRPLDEGTLRCLRFMHDVEFHTVCYLRDLLVSPAHDDPEVTSFLSMWAFEEFWHGEAIAQVLTAHDEPAGRERVARMRRRLGLRERLRPLWMLIGSAVAGRDFVALHMAWGAINEWTTQAGYARLAARAEHPLLDELLKRIMRQEGRHIDFYASQAESRLASSVRAQRITRWALTKLWSPVGSGVMPIAETRHLARYLFGDDEGAKAARRIDRRVSRLPGMQGLNLLESSLRNLTCSPASAGASAFAAQTG